MLSQINKALEMEQNLKKNERHGTNFIYISMKQNNNNKHTTSLKHCNIINSNEPLQQQKVELK